MGARLECTGRLGADTWRGMEWPSAGQSALRLDSTGKHSGEHQLPGSCRRKTECVVRNPEDHAPVREQPSKPCRVLIETVTEDHAFQKTSSTTQNPEHPRHRVIGQAIQFARLLLGQPWDNPRSPLTYHPLVTCWGYRRGGGKRQYPARGGGLPRSGRAMCSRCGGMACLIGGEEGGAG